MSEQSAENDELKWGHVILTVAEFSTLRRGTAEQVQTMLDALVAREVAAAAKADIGAALADQLSSLVKGAKEFKAEHGSCEVIVGPNSPIAAAQIERVAGFPVEVGTVRLVKIDGPRNRDDDTVIDGPLVYFHADDHPMFGSKADPDDGFFGDDDDD